MVFSSKYLHGLAIIAGIVIASFPQTAMTPTLDSNQPRTAPIKVTAASETPTVSLRAVTPVSIQVKMAKKPTPPLSNTLSPKLESTKSPSVIQKKLAIVTAPSYQTVPREVSIERNRRESSISNPHINQTAPPKPINSIGSNIAGTQEIRFDDSRRIKPWGKIYYQLLSETNELKHCVQYNTQCNNPKLRAWGDQIRPLIGLPRQEQIQRVNAIVNQLGYQSDISNYGKADYWSTPTEFMNMRGDCEDFAIFKFASLMALGVSNHDMRVVVGQLDNGQAHAFLSVRNGSGETLLDNRTNIVTSAANRFDFKPSHSMNFVNRWVHLPNKKNSYSG